MNGIRYDKLSVIFKSFIVATIFFGALFILGGSLLLTESSYKQIISYVAMVSLVIYVIVLIIFDRHTIWKSEMASAMDVGSGGIMPTVIFLRPIWRLFAVYFELA